MSWQLFVPVIEKIIDAGVDYYKSTPSNSEESTIPSTTSQEYVILLKTTAKLSKADLTLAVLNYCKANNIEANCKVIETGDINVKIPEIPSEVGQPRAGEEAEEGS